MKNQSRFEDVYEAIEYQKGHPETNIWHFSNPHYWVASAEKPDGNPALACPSPIPSKQAMIEDLKKHYRRGYYWLVFVNDRWGICTSKPQFPAEICEKYYVHGAAINQLAEVEKEALCHSGD